MITFTGCTYISGCTYIICNYNNIIMIIYLYSELQILCSTPLQKKIHTQLLCPGILKMNHHTSYTSSQLAFHSSLDRLWCNSVLSEQSWNVQVCWCPLFSVVIYSIILELKQCITSAFASVCCTTQHLIMHNVCGNRYRSCLGVLCVTYQLVIRYIRFYPFTYGI